MEARKEGGREAWRRRKEGDLPSVGCKPSLVRAIVTRGRKTIGVAGGIFPLVG